MLNEIINIIWIVAIIFLLIGAIYFSIKLKFPQLRLFSLFCGLKNTGNSKISPFQSLTVSLAARIGVGSLAGIALAIYLGGPGSVFWIWVIGIITSINVFCETYLGLCYQEKIKEEYIGGPYFYIFKGLKNKKLSFLYAILVILAYIIGFMTIQANTIVVSINTFLGIDIYLIAIILSVIVTLSIIKGMSGIVKITSKLVPIMGITTIGRRAENTIVLTEPFVSGSHAKIYTKTLQF